MARQTSSPSTRRHDVEEDEIERLRLEPIKPRPSVIRGLDREARLTQADRGHLSDRRVVLDKQDPGIHARQYASRREAPYTQIAGPEAPIARVEASA